MNITLLCENTAGYENAKICSAQWGLSLFIEYEGTKILFDTGHTDVYAKNATAMGIDLEEIDFVVLSHHHWDHTGGLQFHPFLTKKTLITHPEVLPKIPPKESEKIQNDFHVLSSETPLEFSKNIFYLGEIPRKNAFEKGSHKGDALRDDSAIAIKTPKGTVVITGCSHSGICNICEYAKEITGQKLYGVIGGFHLFDPQDEAVKKTITYFKDENPKYLCPMHCVDFSVFAEMYIRFGCKKYSAGDTIAIDCLL